MAECQCEDATPISNEGIESNMSIEKNGDMRRETEASSQNHI